MHFYDGLITIAGGILAASALIIARKPNAKQLIDKLTPYQGWIGTLMFFWGIWEVFQAVRYTELLKTHAFLWIFWLTMGIADLLVGFLLGFGLITKYTLDKNPVARERGQQIRAKLAPYQGMCGLLAIVTGTGYIVLPYVL
jgi:hypothetical protein